MEHISITSFTLQMMSTEKDNKNDIGRLLELRSSVDRVRQLRLYYVRIHEVKDKFQVQIDFGGNITFTFGEGKHLCGKDNFGPVIYTLDLTYIMIDDTHLYVEHKEQFKLIGEYHLNISYVTGLRKQFSYEEKRDRGHWLGDSLDDEHLFLFDIRFHSYYGFHLPGMDEIHFEHFYHILFLGENTGIYTDLCLFTCSLLSDQKYALFTALARQFQTTRLNDHYTFTRRDFQEFFEKCRNYLQYTSTDLRTEPMIVVVILEMIALLTPIKKETFDRDCSSASAFSTKIMSHIRTDFPRLMEVVNPLKWALLKNGLAALSSFEFLYQKPDDSNENKLAFLHQISDEKLRQDIANEILRQLSRLEQPILGNSNWIDLFAIVSPEQINITNMKLAPSFQTLMTCIIKISEVLTDRHQFEQQLATSAFDHNLESKVYHLNNINSIG